MLNINEFMTHQLSEEFPDLRIMAYDIFTSQGTMHEITYDAYATSAQCRKIKHFVSRMKPAHPVKFYRMPF